MTKHTSYPVRASWITLAAVMAALGGPVAAQETANQDQVITNERSEGPGAALQISPADVRRVQQELNKAGYDSANVDGSWGSETVSALCSYQEAKGIEPTGQINPETLVALDLADVFTEEAAGRSQNGQSGGDSDQVVTQEASNGEGVPLYLSTSTVRQIQQDLNQKGYDAGNVDGRSGEDFVRALTSYQQAEDLEPTGTVTVETLQKLDVSFAKGEQDDDDQVITQEAADNGDCGGVDRTTTASISNAGSGTGGTSGSTTAANDDRSHGTQIFLSTATIRKIKQELNKDGYDAGQVDGDADAELSSALKSYQEAEGLEPTGTLTTRTVASLDDVTDISFLSSEGGGDNANDKRSGDSANGANQTTNDETDN